MNAPASCATSLLLLLASSAKAQAPDAGQPPLDLAPLTQPKPPWLRKPAQKPEAPKKKSAKKPGKKTAPQALEALPPVAPLVEPAKPAPSPAQVELPLLPLVPLQPDAAPLPLMLSSLGVLLQNDGLPPPAAARVEEALRGVARIAPLSRAVPAPPKPEKPCADDACFAALAAPLKIDHLLVANDARGGLSLRLLDVEGKKLISQAEQASVTPEPTEAAAWAEALACKLLVPAGCTGEAAVDAGEGVLLELDGKPLARGEKRRVEVGVHQLRVLAGAKTLQRPFPVLREGAPLLHARQMDGEPRLLNGAEMMPAAALASAPAPAAQRRWTRPAGIAAAGVGVELAAAGAYLGARSRSDLNQAESAYRLHGGAYLGSDLSALQSGNSKARTANGLFIASGALLATGALLTFAF
jgi:hypothetical protein